MIINGLGIGNIDDQRKLNLSASKMDWAITSHDGQTLSGDIGPGGYADVTPPGKGPWKVKMGIGGFSQRGSVSGIDSPSAVVSGVSLFPVPPNGVDIVVTEPE